MKQHLLGMALLAVSASAWSLSCTPKPPFKVLHTSNVYANSVFWLKSAMPESEAPISVANLQLKQKDKVGPKLEALPLRIGEFTGFKAKTKLRAGQTYQVVLDKKRGHYAFLSDLANIFTVKTEENSKPALAWSELPKLVQVNYYINTKWGDSGHVLWAVNATRPINDYLVVIKLAPERNMEKAQTYIRYPQFLGNRNIVAVSFRPCEYGSDFFVFEKDSTAWVQFDLLSHDGKIIPWQGEAQKIILTPQ